LLDSNQIEATSKKLQAIVLLLPAALFLSAQAYSQAAPTISSPKADTRISRTEYVGDQACAACHRERVETFHQTAHYLSSRFPAKDTILGDFTPPGNLLKTSNPDLFYRMEEKKDGFFQTAVEGEPPYSESRTERFGLVIGSGGKGQTYLYWNVDRLFQLPVSYWKELGWVNSPGYRDGVANFDRPIIPRCLECHATYFEPIPPSPQSVHSGGFLRGHHL
jgi:hypothetical protein